MDCKAGCGRKAGSNESREQVVNPDGDFHAVARAAGGLGFRRRAAVSHRGWEPGNLSGQLLQIIQLGRIDVIEAGGAAKGRRSARASD